MVDLREISALVADMHDALERTAADLAEIRTRMERLGLQPSRVSITRREELRVAPRKARPKPRLWRGKSLTALTWLRMALRDGDLPRPTSNLDIPDKVIAKAKSRLWIEGNGHPYRITPDGRAAIKPRKRTAKSG